MKKVLQRPESGYRRSVKVAICVPFLGDVKGRCAGSLFALGRANPSIDLNLLLHTSSTLPIGRNTLATEALKWGADWLLWIDSDQTFPPDTLTRLLAHERSFVAANIRRRIPDRVVASCRGLDGNLVETSGAKGGGLEEVASVGFGLCLVGRAVFEMVASPWFDIELAPDGLTGTHEDYYFCREARKAGVQIFVDHALSMEVGHIAETVLTFR